MGSVLSSCDDYKVALPASSQFILTEPSISAWCSEPPKAGGERLVPTVGEAPQAAQRATATGYLFPNYCDGQITKANSASAALNK